MADRYYEKTLADGSTVKIAKPRPAGPDDTRAEQGWMLPVGYMRIDDFEAMRSGKRLSAKIYMYREEIAGEAMILYGRADD